MNLENLKDILSENFGIEGETIMMDSKLQEDLGLDSLDAVELSMSIEEDYGIEISDEDFSKFVTVGDIIDYVESNK
ncbi:hypothetical protein ING2D1G_1348 [Peptoniphilus sp. ING2-D1G]|nr:hypothetical protein ING2D1G_1348 [Peptoniphilus sp. ING2-D1G]